MEEIRKLFTLIEWLTFEFDLTKDEVVLQVPKEMFDEIILKKEYIQRGRIMDIVEHIESPTVKEFKNKFSGKSVPTLSINQELAADFMLNLNECIGKVLDDIDFSIDMEEHNIFIRKQISLINDYLQNVQIIEIGNDRVKVLNNISVIEIKYKDDNKYLEKIKSYIDINSYTALKYLDRIVLVSDYIIKSLENLKSKFEELIEPQNSEVEKVKFGLTVYELIVLFRLLKEEGLIYNNVTSLTKFMADNVRAKSKVDENLSQNSLLKKWYDLDPESISNVRARLSNILQKITKSYLK